ncbi:MAG TPA: flagellar protein FlaG [Gammaproteobacteria bacterium]|nr:flagellar protein FlaG [Gammaproteobacteria bacterium]
MSSDYLTATHVLESARLQGSQPAPSTPGPVAPVPADVVRRNESAAASGQLLPPDSTEEPADSEQVESAVSKISDYVQNFQRDLQFSVDKASGRTIIKVVDSETDQVIRQIPSEETLRIAEQLDSPESLIFSQQA